MKINSFIENTFGLQIFLASIETLIKKNGKWKCHGIYSFIKVIFKDISSDKAYILVSQ